MNNSIIEEQKEFFNEIDNVISNNKIIHAFLIETNNYKDKDEIILLFIKKIFENYISDQDELNNVYTLIDNNTLSDLIIIEPDGTIIKKEQVLAIKEKFKTTSVDNRPRIYWIKDADKLNKYAANSLLKFLEEPDGNVIAILDTSNRYQVMETIRSRCQIYNLINNKKIKSIENLELVEKIIETFERNGKKSIAFLPAELDNDLRNKEFWNEIFSSMIDIYEAAIRKKESIPYTIESNIIDFINERNSLQSLINKIDVLFTTLSNLDYNLNVAMMLDKFIIDFTGGE